MLAQHLQSCRFSVTKSVGDADIDVVSVAVKLAQSGSPVMVYAEDIDILALLVYHWQPCLPWHPLSSNLMPDLKMVLLASVSTSLLFKAVWDQMSA